MAISASLLFQQVLVDLPGRKSVLSSCIVRIARDPSIAISIAGESEHMLFHPAEYVVKNTTGKLLITNASDKLVRTIILHTDRNPGTASPFHLPEACAMLGQVWQVARWARVAPLDGRRSLSATRDPKNPVPSEGTAGHPRSSSCAPFLSPSMSPLRTVQYTPMRAPCTRLGGWAPRDADVCLVARWRLAAAKGLPVAQMKETAGDKIAALKRLQKLVLSNLRHLSSDARLGMSRRSYEARMEFATVHYWSNPSAHDCNASVLSPAELLSVDTRRVAVAQSASPASGSLGAPAATTDRTSDVCPLLPSPQEIRSRNSGLQGKEYNHHDSGHRQATKTPTHGSRASQGWASLDQAAAEGSLSHLLSARSSSAAWLQGQPAVSTTRSGATRSPVPSPRSTVVKIRNFRRQEQENRHHNSSTETPTRGSRAWQGANLRTRTDYARPNHASVLHQSSDATGGGQSQAYMLGYNEAIASMGLSMTGGMGSLPYMSTWQPAPHGLTVQDAAMPGPRPGFQGLWGYPYPQMQMHAPIQVGTTPGTFPSPTYGADQAPEQQVQDRTGST